jgi:serine/threonine-protein kinase HipA
MAEIAVLNVQLYGETIGTITRLPGDRNLFAFEQSYIDNPERPTLSLSFKSAFGELVTNAPPVQTRLPPFFSNLMPEGPMRDLLAERAHVNPAREFFLAWVLGQDLPGALKLTPANGDEVPADDRADVAPHDEIALDEEPVLRFSLAGVQLKFSAIQEANGGLTIPVDGTGGRWIVKLPSVNFKRVPENEFAMMEMARRIGIKVPETRLVDIRDIAGLPKSMEVLGNKAFVAKRFDRAANGNVVHMEDFAQVFGVFPEQKYKNASYGNIARIIWIEIGEQGVAEFVRRFVFNALIGNADMHLKNWSFLYPDKRAAALSPAYDFVSTIAHLPDDKMALTFVGSKLFESLTLEQMKRFAGKTGLPEKLTLDITTQTVEDFRAVWKASGDLSVDDFVRDRIDLHLGKIPIWKI